MRDFWESIILFLVNHNLTQRGEWPSAAFAIVIFEAISRFNCKLEDYLNSACSVTKTLPLGLCWPSDSFSSLFCTCVFSWLCTRHFLLLLQQPAWFFLWTEPSGVFQSQLIVLFCLRSACEVTVALHSCVLVRLCRQSSAECLHHRWLRKGSLIAWYWGRDAGDLDKNKTLPNKGRPECTCTGRMSTCCHLLATHQNSWEQHRIQHQFSLFLIYDPTLRTRHLTVPVLPSSLAKSSAATNAKWMRISGLLLCTLDCKCWPIIRIQCVIKHQLLLWKLTLHRWNGQEAAQESISLSVNGLLLL